MPTRPYGRMPRNVVSGASAAPYQTTPKRPRPPRVDWAILDRARNWRRAAESRQPRVISGSVTIHPPQGGG